MLPIVVTSGEPAGIGPEICLRLAQRDQSATFCVIGDPTLLKARAECVATQVTVVARATIDEIEPHVAGTLQVLSEPLRAECTPGSLDPSNSAYVIALIEKAATLCHHGAAGAMVTAPVQKSVIQKAGVNFSGHTEFLAELVGGEPMMLLAGRRLRVALVTTHLPIAQVPEAISLESVASAIRRLDSGLRERFRLAEPRILVLGLNPHAGESGYLGREEIETIAPAIALTRHEGINVTGPAAADTAFGPELMTQVDAVLAMYHDQGLTPIKALEFGDLVNVTLGLPIVRTSVDHGTALTLAGTGAASPKSLLAAFDLAAQLAAT